MAKFISSLTDVGALPLTQSPQSFDPNSAESRKLVKQMQLGKALVETMKSWIDGICDEGCTFIWEFLSTCMDGEALLGEVQTLIPTSELEEEKCVAICTQIREIEMYVVTQFLAENSMKLVDPCMLFILKQNFGWKSMMIKATISQVKAIEKEVLDMHANALKDIKIMNPVGALQIDEGDKDADALVKVFIDTMNALKEGETPTVQDFTKIANVESMLFLNRG